MRRIIIVAAIMMTMTAGSAFAVPTLQVGIQDSYGNYLPYGYPDETALATSSPFNLAVGGVYNKNNPEINIGGKYNTTDWSNFSLNFLNGATGAVLLVTVPEGSIPSLAFTLPSGASYSAPAYIANRTGSNNSGFPNNHFPVGADALFDYYYYDLNTAFLKTGVVPDFADSSQGSASGEVRTYELAISGTTFAHFDLLAIVVDQNGNHLSTTLANNPGSHDASYNPVPEPGTMVLLGSGLVGLAGWGRKRFRK